MSRIKRLAHSMASGYVLLAANIIYTLGSFRLAGKYLTTPEFGLWAVSTNIAQYLALVDLGMISTSRILIDYKDQKETGSYGSVIQTFQIVSVVQGLVIIAFGIGLAGALAFLIHIPNPLHREFVYLCWGQCGLCGAGFLTRILALLLAAHQRSDVSNYAQTMGFVVGLGVFVLGFKARQGVYSTLWAQCASWFLSSAICYGAVVKLKLFPPRHCWGRPTWARLRELFSFGFDLFLYSLGFQLLSASQTIILTRALGLEASALWSVCTRAFAVVGQIVYRLFDYATPALAEMIVRQEKDRLYSRFRSLVILSASLAVSAGALFAVCNQPFVTVWMAGRFTWPPINDLLLALWLLLQTVARCHLGLVGQTKQIQSMRYIYLVEGTVFIASALVVVPWGGITWLLACSILTTASFSLPYGLWRTSLYFRIRLSVPAIEWWLPPMRLALAVGPLAVLAWWLTRPLPVTPQLLLRASIGSLAISGLILRFGVDSSFRQELLSRAPLRLRPLVHLLGR